MFAQLGAHCWVRLSRPSHDRWGLPRAATQAPADYSDLSDYEVMRQILAAVRSIRAMVLFFTIPAILGIVVQLAVLSSAQ
jgi:hypothetical protein